MGRFIKELFRRQRRDKMGYVGTLIAHVKRAGSDKWELLWEKKNLIVNTGYAQMALLWNAGTGFGYGGIGTGTNAAQATDTALQTEINRVSGSFSRITTTVTDDTSQLVTVHTATGSWAITEYGAFNAASAGVIFNRLVFGAISLAVDDQLQFTYKVQHKSGA